MCEGGRGLCIEEELYLRLTGGGGVGDRGDRRAASSQLTRAASSQLTPCKGLKGIRGRADSRNERKVYGGERE